ncbi:acyl-CoA synthetase (AMP-forming)/AMP-acid ligase II [Geodermatophilus tzadiensis]|uniref:Acyl-CoA synthetase (AMP-forming)/AMP-acid ligase II n=1 Tax=Geodermatophilus tzadiensis TaxID=1137988 RepID=A0A2T0U079_9ACTN|nr:AMP-binding protein [Geodermatophilus tzadiensis]PRY51327.1 acyl-CoA synthetase (AMP-forming)/AMP-acid ligase II [Geodermatophilus tzadiensis]
MTAQPGASPAVVDVSAAADPVAAFLDAHERGHLVALRTSGTTGRARAVVRTPASWTGSFPHVSRLAGLDAGARVWVPGPLAATMNLFAVVHARWVGAAVVTAPEQATHAHLTPAALVAALAAGTDLRGRTVVVAGDRLARQVAGRAAAAGAAVHHYYGAAELSFVAWGSAEDDLRLFPDVTAQVRAGRLWVRSPWLALGYDGADGPFTRDDDGFATVGDRGSLDGASLTVRGRGCDAVVTAGATVLVDDVESVLRRATGGDVVVVGVPHARLGAVVTAVLADPALLPAARAAARAGLGPAERPHRWLHAPAFPLTPGGKVDRAALAALAASGALAPAAPR